MYGGLFGDLPQAKNSKAKDEDTNSADIKKSEKPSEVEGASKESGKYDAAPVPKKSFAMPRKSSSKPVGITANTMAFIPAAARRKRHAAPKKPTITSSVTESRPINSTSGLGGSLVVSTFKTQQATSIKKEATENLTTAKVQSVHELLHQENPGSGTHELSNIKKEDMVGHKSNSEPEELRLLHEKALAEDPYDPLCPNDLLQYWERKAFEKERIQLERERERTLQEQEKLRERLKREREELARSGDVQQLDRHRIVPSGRGRGVSNIPAWLIEKQKKEQGNAVGRAGTQNSKRLKN